MIIAGASPGETKMWAAVRENGDFLHLRFEFRRPNISSDLLPSVMSDVRRVGAAKLLGVHLTQNLSFSQHIDAVVTVCNHNFTCYLDGIT